MLFCGRTGVGKTQHAKTVARYLFGHGRQADRLITKIDGRPSDLIDRVRRQPFVVVLFDE